MNEPRNPYAAPRAEVADIDPSGAGLKLASRSRRLVGATIDTLLLVPVAIPVSFALAAVIGIDLWASEAELDRLSEDPLFERLCELASVVGFYLLNGWLLVTRGQTLGKLILGMRIVHPDGSRVSAPRVLGLRYGVTMLISCVPVVGIWVWFVNVLWIFGPQRRCLHDLLANTIVIKL